MSGQSTKKKTISDIIEKANIIHNNVYDYSKSVYINMHTKIIIICNIHGEFYQTPADHIHKKAGCKECSSKRRINTNLIKYGVPHPRQNEEVKAKQCQTNLDRYGCHPTQTIEVQEKMKQTNLDRYGVEYATQNYEIREKIKINNNLKYGVDWTTQSSEKIEKTKQTWLMKYGVDNPLKSNIIREKIKQTNLERYGCHPSQTPEVQHKRAQTNLTRYNVDNPFKSNIIKGQIKQINLIRYNTAYPTQHPTIKEKRQQTFIKKYGVNNVFKTDKFKQHKIQNNLNKYGVNFHNQKHMINILPLIEDYDWLFDQYIIQNKSAIQIADELHIGDTTIGRYLRKLEIDIKNQTSYSYSCIMWIETIMEQEGIYIQHAMNEGEYSIPGTRYKADGYCKETNTIYEFHGDYWHGNPLIYEADVINESTNCTMGELYQKTLLKEQTIHELGYTLIIKWETD